MNYRCSGFMVFASLPSSHNGQLQRQVVIESGYKFPLMNQTNFNFHSANNQLHDRHAINIASVQKRSRWPKSFPYLPIRLAMPVPADSKRDLGYDQQGGRRWLWYGGCVRE